MRGIARSAIAFSNVDRYASLRANSHIAIALTTHFEHTEPSRTVRLGRDDKEAIQPSSDAGGGN